MLLPTYYISIINIPHIIIYSSPYSHKLCLYSIILFEQQPIPSQQVSFYTIYYGLLTQCKARANNNISIYNVMAL